MDQISTILLYAFFLFTGVQLIYYIIVFSKNLGKPAESKSNTEGISVVICSRNEKKNLEEHLTKFLDQNFANFEVIVVNDGSTDELKTAGQIIYHKHHKGCSHSRHAIQHKKTNTKKNKNVTPYILNKKKCKVCLLSNHVSVGNKTSKIL